MLQATLGVSDRIDLAACSLEEVHSKPQSKSTFMLTRQLAKARASETGAGQPVLALTADPRERAADAPAEPDAAVSISIRQSSKSAAR